MRSRLARRLVAPLALALVAATVGPRLALCVGSDGHRAIEPLAADCCEPTAPAPERSLVACAESCVDSPLRLWLEAPASGRHAHGAPVVASSTPPSSASTALAPASVASWSQRGDSHGRPPSGCTAVLRC